MIHQNIRKVFLIIIIDLLINIFKFSSRLLKGSDLKNEIQLNYYSSISFIEKPKLFGGPGTFQKNLTDEFEKKKILVKYKSDNIKTDYFIVIGSSVRNFFLVIENEISRFKNDS